jgi:hypothetical protein
MTAPSIPAPRSGLPPLDLVAVERVQRLSQRAVPYCLDLVAAYLSEHERLDRPTFLRLCDEAEAVMGR